MEPRSFANLAVTITLDKWIPLLSADPVTTWTLPLIAVRIVSGWWSATDQDPDELASDVCLRLFKKDRALPRRRPGNTKLIDLIRGILKRVLKERRRSKRTELVDPMSPTMTQIPDQNGIGRAQREEAIEALWAVAATLPPPYCYIAFLRLDHNATREEIHTYLNTFRSLSLPHTRRYLTRMSRMLRAAGEGKDLRLAFPAAFAERKNPFFLIPPPIPNHIWLAARLGLGWSPADATT